MMKQVMLLLLFSSLLLCSFSFANGQRDLSSAESFALATSSARARMLAERYTANSLEGFTGALQQIQVQIIEARDTNASEETLRALLEEEAKLANALRASPFNYDSTAQKFLLRHDLLTLDREDSSARFKEDSREHVLQRLQQRLGVSYPYAQQLPSNLAVAAEEESKPSVLDSSRLSLSTLLGSVLNGGSNPGGVHALTPLAWEWLAHQPLTPQQLAQLLQQQTQPTLSNIVELVARQLDETPPPNSGMYPVQFGQTNLHRLLTLEQLQQLGEVKPELFESTFFVQSLLLKGQPRELLSGSVASFDEPEREGGLSDSAKKAYLEDLWSTALTLGPMHTETKGSVMFHVLHYHMTLFDQVDFDRLQKFMELPRVNTPQLEYQLIGMYEFDRKHPLFYAGRPAFVNMMAASSASIFTKLSLVNEQALLEYALKKAQQVAGDDVTLSKLMSSSSSGWLLSSSSAAWLKYMQRDWASRVLAQNILTDPSLSAHLTPAQLDQQKVLLGTTVVANLKALVRLEFGSLNPSVHNPSSYRSADPVSLRVILKACPTLIVRVFWIHARNFYTKKLQEIDAANIELDGLTPREERVLQYGAEAGYSDFHAYERVLDFESLSAEKRGVWVVELLGGGYRARSIIRKGAIAALHSPSAQGHMIRLVDEETAQPLRRATIFLGGQTYNADSESGLVLVPYSTQPTGEQQIVLTGSLPGDDFSDASADASDSTFASLSSFAHFPEQYDFSARFFVDRESLLANTRASVLVSASVAIHGQSLSVERVLKKSVLKVHMVDDEGTQSTQLVEGFALHDDKETVHTILVPPHLASVEFTLTGEVARLSSPGEFQQVSASTRLELNKLDASNFIEDLFLASGRPGPKDKYGRGADKMRRSGEASAESEEDSEGAMSYSLYCLGKSGEPVRGRVVRLRLTHDLVRDPLPHEPWMDLATDAEGRIELGSLPHVIDISATILNAGGSGGAVTTAGAGTNAVPQQHHWDLRSNTRSMQRPFVIQAGQALEIPFDSARSNLNVEELAGAPSFVLFEQMADGQLGSALPSSKHVQLLLTATKRVIRVADLPAGRFVLMCKAALWFNDRQYHSWPIRVIKGPLVMNEYIMDKRARQFVRTEKPQIQKAGALQIVSATTEKATTATKTGEAEVVLQLAGVNPSTRVHVVATHFHPTFSSLQSIFSPHALEVSEGRARSLDYGLAPSVYMMQKQLGDEMQYVLDRSLAVGEQQRLGNMLPRPSLLMNERFKQKTHFSDEPTLNAGETYTAADVAASAPPSSQRSFFAPEALMMSGGGGRRGQRMYASPESMDMVNGEGSSDRMGSGNYGGGSSSDMMLLLDHDDDAGGNNVEAMRSAGIVFSGDLDGDPASRMQLEFLARPSVVLANLHPEPHSQTLRIPLSSFARSHLQISIVAVDSLGQVATFRHALRDASSTLRRSANATALVLDGAFRDTRLPASLDPSKRFAERALISLLATGESLAISAAATSGAEGGRLETFDTLGDFWTLLNTLAAAAGDGGGGGGRPDLLEHLPKFEFLTRWGALSAEKKQALYGQFASHELNVFLYFKDANFFQRVVQPAIKTKFRKTFVDDFLIGEKDLSAYLQPHAFDVLNTFERVLLAIRLHASPQPSHVKAASSILDLIVQSAQAWCKEDRVADAAFFQTALQSKALGASAEPPPPSPSDAEENKKKEAGQGQSPAASPELMQPQHVEMMMKRSFAPLGAAAAPQAVAASMAMNSAAGFAAASSSFDAYSARLDQSRAQAARKLYSSPPTTVEYEERDYFATSDNTKDLFGINRFWADYAKHVRNGWKLAAKATKEKAGDASTEVTPRPFLSAHLGEPLVSLTDILLRMAVLDLPLPGAQRPHVTTTTAAAAESREQSTHLQAGSPTIVFYRNLREVQPEPSTSASAGALAPAASPVSISSTYFDPYDLFMQPTAGDDDAEGGGERVDRFIVDEFLTRRLYGCRVVLTNVASSRQALEVLLQIPQGAVAVGSFGRRGLGTSTRLVDLSPYGSHVALYLFYFPAPGIFRHYAPSATKKGGRTSVGVGQPGILKVVSAPSKAPAKNLRDWTQLSQTGTNEEVLGFLREQNLLKVQLSLMCWRFLPASAAHNSVAGDPKEFFRDVTAILRERLVYDEQVWSFALVLGDSMALRELLQRSWPITQQIGSYFSSNLVSKDAAEYEWSEYTHLEYSPLLNARAHTLRTFGGSGGRVDKKSLTIQNMQLEQQYASLLEYLSQRVSGSEQFSVMHKLSLTYYLLLQDRIKEAQDMFESVQTAVEDAESVSSVLPCQLQYDYLRCYFSFFSSSPSALSAALRIAEGYANHPIAKKQKLFMEVRSQIREVLALTAPVKEEPGADEPANPEDLTPRDDLDRERELHELARSEPSLDLVFPSATDMAIVYENVREVHLNFYRMNAELMFSAAPFLMAEGASGPTGGATTAASLDKATTSNFLFVTPNLTLHIDLPAADPGQHPEPFLVTIPEQFQQTNCWIELTDGGTTSPSGSRVAAAGAGGLSVVKPHFAHQLRVQMTPNYGQVKVSHASTSKPLPGSYVKVYSRPKDGGAATFYKDGYTDLRGRFDYASLSTDKLQSVQQFALLILHPQFGAVVKVTDPPQQ